MYLRKKLLELEQKIPKRRVSPQAKAIIKKYGLNQQGNIIYAVDHLHPITEAEITTLKNAGLDVTIFRLVYPDGTSPDNDLQAGKPLPDENS